uniref:NADH-ubiquinone oxidoreductase chain 5 n=1 Tax=Cardiocondyla obscurior TaxID=286306 RepID=A0A343AXS9_9HYME|nr:NADH dehydrogenase subunit 5 [Cardiocondyla obscurior]
MMKIFVYVIIMILLFIFSSLISLYMYYLGESIMMEWVIFSFNSINLEYLIYLDWMSMLFISFILLISSMVLIYSFSYMSEDKFIDRFISLVLLFIFSMVIMIISPNVVSILFGWDGLGLVSYGLVIYYQNCLSYNCGMVTVLSNRLGDVGLLMGISILMMSGSWNFWLIESSKIMIFMLILAAITKSAQMPFSVWLPMAMAAPTPVSALVHSSTLVTAGVYLMIRYSDYLFESGLNNWLLYLSVMTMFMAGLMANLENDLKKIIALSTLSQLGLMMMILSLGFKMMAFYHLLTHAVFKSMLFMCAGSVIHVMMNNQDIRMFGGLKEFMPFTMMGFIISKMALCGFPFLAGFYSKDYIMELVYSMSMNFMIMLIAVISLMLTVSYSVRLIIYVFFSDMKFSSYMNLSESKIMNFSMVILMSLSIIVGSLLNWLFFFDMYLVFIELNLKILTLILSLSGVFMGMMIFNKNLIKKFYFLNFYLSSMWFLMSFYQWIYWPKIWVGIQGFTLDKTWMEFSSKGLFLYINKKMSKIYIYKIYMFLGILSFLMILMNFIY